jgi:hypothetical protein
MDTTMLIRAAAGVGAVLIAAIIIWRRSRRESE